MTLCSDGTIRVWRQSRSATDTHTTGVSFQDIRDSSFRGTDAEQKAPKRGLFTSRRKMRAQMALNLGLSFLAQAQAQQQAQARAQLGPSASPKEGLTPVGAGVLDAMSPRTHDDSAIPTAPHGQSMTPSPSNQDIAAARAATPAATPVHGLQHAGGVHVSASVPDLKALLLTKTPSGSNAAGAGQGTPQPNTPSKQASPPAPVVSAFAASAFGSYALPGAPTINLCQWYIACELEVASLQVAAENLYVGCTWLAPGHHSDATSEPHITRTFCLHKTSFVDCCV